MGYLDKEGLSYFWRKVRTALSGKQEQLTPDESLVLDGGNISLIWTRPQINLETDC